MQGDRTKSHISLRWLPALIVLSTWIVDAAQGHLGVEAEQGSVGDVSSRHHGGAVLKRSELASMVATKTASLLRRKEQSSREAEVTWSYLGPVLGPLNPRLRTIFTFEEGVVGIGFEPYGQEELATTILWDVASGRQLAVVESPVPLSMPCPAGALSGLTIVQNRLQQIIHNDPTRGASSTRIVVLPEPGGASARAPYLTSPVYQSPDGDLLVLGTGRDRFYRLDAAIGQVEKLFPGEALHIIDFDVTTSGRIVAIDAHERQLVWLDQKTGKVVRRLELAVGGSREPDHYYPSVAAGANDAVWLGCAVREQDGSFAAEVQRIRGMMRERQRLVRPDGTHGLPLLLVSDDSGGVYAADERNWIYHVSDSAVVTHVWQARTPYAGLGELNQGDPAYLTETGVEVTGLEVLMEASIAPLEDCFEKLLKVSPDTTGTYRVKLTTMDRGVRRVDVYHKDFEDFGLESCVARVLRNLRSSSRFGLQTLRIQLRFGPATAK